jgi:hypothetical protein
MWNVCRSRNECAGSSYNAQGFVAENINSFSTTVTFILIDKEKNSVFLVTA